MALTIGLVQINNSFSDASYFPYSVGLLEAYYRTYGQAKESTVFLAMCILRLDYSPDRIT